MNVFLKAAIDEAFDLEAAGVEIAGKHYAEALGKAVKIVEDAPALVGSVSDAKAELSALLSDPSADADLLSYVSGKLGGESPETQAVIAASADLLLTTGEKIAVLIKAIKAAKAGDAAKAQTAATPAGAPAS